MHVCVNVCVLGISVLSAHLFLILAYTYTHACMHSAYHTCNVNDCGQQVLDLDFASFTEFLEWDRRFEHALIQVCIHSLQFIGSMCKNVCNWCTCVSFTELLEWDRRFEYALIQVCVHALQCRGSMCKNVCNQCTCVYMYSHIRKRERLCMLLDAFLCD
jgi:hypothetical protein